MPELAEVPVLRQPHRLELAADIPVAGPAEQVAHPRVGRIGGSEDRRRLGRDVRTPRLCHVQRRQQRPSSVAQRQRPSRPRDRQQFLRYIQHDRNRPQRAVGQPHPVADRVVIVLAEEGPQRREAAAGEQLQVT